MKAKPTVWIGLALGSFIGEIIPSLWGADTFSFSSIFLSTIGAIVGIYIGFKISRE